MKITKLHLKDFQQFKDLMLDFTHPDTGKPLDRVCFIGSNGTGKTTILEQLSTALNGILVSDQIIIRNIDDKGNFPGELDKQYSHFISADFLIDSVTKNVSIIDNGLGIDMARKTYHVQKGIQRYEFSQLDKITDKGFSDVKDLINLSH